MSEKNYITRGIYLSYLHMFISLMLTFVLTPIMVKHLGRSVYGLWAVLGSIIGYFGLFHFGMLTAVVKFTAEYRARAQQEYLNKIISTILAVFIPIGVLVILVCIGLAWFIPRLFHLEKDLVSVARIAFLIAGLTVVSGFFGRILGGIIYGCQRLDILKTLNIIHAVVNAVLIIVFLHLGWGLIGVVVASFLGIVILLILHLLVIYRSNYGIVIHPRLADIKILRKIAPYSLRSFVLGLTSQISFQTDNIVISVFLLISFVTPYSIAYRLCFVVVTLVAKISTVFFPTFSKLYALEDIDGLRSLYLKIVKTSVAIFTPLALFLIFFGQSFINLWVGKENFVGMSVLLVLILIAFLHSFAGPIGTLLQAIGQNREVMYLSIVMAVLNLALSIILVRKIGLLGVALGTLISHLCTGSWLGPLLVCKYIKLPVGTFFRSGVLPPLLAGVPAAAITLVFIRNLFFDNLFCLGVKGVLVVAVYGFFYLAFAVTKQERRMYFGLIPRFSYG